MRARDEGRQLTACLFATPGAVAIFVALAAPAAAQETLGGDPNITVSYYEVAGVTAPSIERAIEARGISTIGRGQQAWGLTTAEFGYRWSRGGEGALDCDLSRATVTYKITVLLPRLAPGTKLRGETGQWWLATSANLRHHELDHVRLALGYAEKMRAAIRAATCLTAADEAKRVMEAFSQANAAYDGATAHGTRVPTLRKKIKE